MEANEKPVLLTGPVFGIFRTVAEVSDSPTDPESKIFRFRDGCNWKAGKNSIRSISVWAYWSEQHVPKDAEADYQTCRKLAAEPGFVAVIEASNKPKPEAAAVPEFDADAAKCEDAIMKALEAEPRMTASALKRKTHVERFGRELWEKCLHNLERAGELRLHAEGFGRIWVTLCDGLAPATPEPAPSE